MRLTGTHGLVQVRSDVSPFRLRPIFFQGDIALHRLNYSSKKPQQEMGWEGGTHYRGASHYRGVLLLRGGSYIWDVNLNNFELELRDLLNWVLPNEVSTVV